MTIEIDPPSSFLKRVLLRLMLALVAAAVAVAIVQVLRGASLGETISKMVWTSMVAGIYGAFAVACANAADKKPSLFAFAGIAAACAAVGIFFVGVWFESRNPTLWKAFSIASLYSAALWRCARYTLANVGPVGTVVVRATMAASLAIATVITMMIIRGEVHTTLMRVMNALWIVCAGGHIAIPILEKLHDKPE